MWPANLILIMRYFIELAYRGTNYCGYQIQPNGVSIQGTIEEAISTILNRKTSVVGCGRTDAGVHASQYYLHFEYEGEFPKAFLKRLNNFLPKDIALRRLFPVTDDMHARFDAKKRSYEYYVDFYKDPFRYETAYYFYAGPNLLLEKLNEAASLLLEYQEFKPFCKSNSDAKTMICHLTTSKWEIQENGLVYHISANRFLRGMVRLIVGACLLVGEGKLSIEDLKTALERQEPLKKSWSVPPQGLFLSEVIYPPFERGGEDGQFIF